MGESPNRFGFVLNDAGDASLLIMDVTVVGEPLVVFCWSKFDVLLLFFFFMFSFSLEVLIRFFLLCLVLCICL